MGGARPRRHTGAGEHGDVYDAGCSCSGFGLMADWLVEQGGNPHGDGADRVDTYWRPVFYCLEERMECRLLMPDAWRWVSSSHLAPLSS